MVISVWRRHGLTVVATSPELALSLMGLPLPDLVKACDDKDDDDNDEPYNEDDNEPSGLEGGQRPWDRWRRWARAVSW